MSSLRNILSSLPELGDGQLSVVIATASQLRAERSGVAPGGRGFRGRGGPPAKRGRPKGPALQASPWEGIPEHREFKAAEKAMRSLLKQHKLSLKEAEASPVTRDDPVLARFKTAQAVWFRSKAGAASRADEISSAAQEGETTSAAEGRRSGSFAPGSPFTPSDC